MKNMLHKTEMLISDQNTQKTFHVSPMRAKYQCQCVCIQILIDFVNLLLIVNYKNATEIIIF